MQADLTRRAFGIPESAEVRPVKAQELGAQGALRPSRAFLSHDALPVGVRIR